MRHGYERRAERGRRIGSLRSGRRLSLSSRHARERPPDSVPQPLHAFCVELLEHHLSRETLDHADVVAAGERCLLELGAQLVGLVGIAGARAVLDRALQLAAAELPYLHHVRPSGAQPGRVFGLRHCLRRLSPADVQQAVALIIAEWIWLLTHLIGSTLALRVLRDVWPRISEADLGEPAR